jgi:hypothetical protein
VDPSGLGYDSVRCSKDLLRRIRNRCNTIWMTGAARRPTEFAHNVSCTAIILNSFSSGQDVLLDVSGLLFKVFQF